MSSKKSKRGSPCPGCKTPNALHSFGIPCKQCEGPEPVSDEDLSLTTTNKQQSTEILKAIRMLSGQVEALKLEQAKIKAQLVDGKHMGSSSLGPVKQPTAGMITSSNNYVDLYSLLPSTIPTAFDEAKRAPTIESFD